MSVTLATVVRTVFKGVSVWRYLKPWRRLKVLRNKRRARKGKPLLELDEEDLKMLPKGTMTYAGIATAVVGVALRLFGVGECSVEEMATSVEACVDPTVVDRLVASANELLEMGGLLIATIGKRRAAKREAAIAAKVATLPP